MSKSNDKSQNNEEDRSLFARRASASDAGSISADDLPSKDAEGSEEERES